MPHVDAGWSSLVARRAHNPKVIGSNPVPATKYRKSRYSPECRLFCVCTAPATSAIRQSQNPKVIGSLWFQGQRSPLPNIEKADTHSSVGFFVSGRHLETNTIRQSQTPKVIGSLWFQGQRSPLPNIEKPILIRVSAFLCLAGAHHQLGLFTPLANSAVALYGCGGTQATDAGQVEGERPGVNA